jgi:hypothetical protein
MDLWPQFSRTWQHWTDLIGHAQLRSFVDGEGHFWLEQNATKQTKWAKLAREEHDVA